MAVTLNLQHTFSTRVVFTSAELEEARKELEVTAGKLVAALERHELEGNLSHKQVAACKVSVKMLDELQAMDDEELVKSLVSRGVRSNLRKDMEDTFEAIGVTRVSPVQTVVL